MNSAFWIAISAAVLVVLAHIGLFWWFICKGQRKTHGDAPGESTSSVSSHSKISE